MEKINTDYKQRNRKMQAKLFKPFNRDAALYAALSEYRSVIWEFLLMVKPSWHLRIYFE